MYTTKKTQPQSGYDNTQDMEFMDYVEVYKKIKAMRMLKGWSQDEIAEKLGIAVNSYSKIERGETDVSLSRLAQIAEIMEVDLSQLLELNGHNILHVLNNNNCADWKFVQTLQGNILLSETQCAHELEKSQLLVQEQQKEIENLKKQITQLEEMVQILKKSLSN